MCKSLSVTREVFSLIETMELFNSSRRYSRRRRRIGNPWLVRCSSTRSPGPLVTYRWIRDSSLLLKASHLFLLLSLFLSFFSPPIITTFDDSHDESSLSFSSPQYLIGNDHKKWMLGTFLSSFPISSSSSSSSLVDIPRLVFGSAVSVHLTSSSSSEEENNQGKAEEVDDVDLLFRPEENATASDTGTLGHSSGEEPSEPSHQEEDGGESPALANQSQTEADEPNHKKEDGGEEENFSFHSVQEEADDEETNKSQGEVKGSQQQENNSSSHHEGVEEQHVEGSHQSETEKKDYVTMPSTSVSHAPSQHPSPFNEKAEDEDEEKEDDDEDDGDELLPKEDKKKKSEAMASVDSHKHDIPIESIPIFNQSSRHKERKSKGEKPHDVMFLSSSSSPWKKSGEGSKEEVIVEKLLKKAKALGKALSKHQEYLARKKSQEDHEHKRRHMLSYTSSLSKPLHLDSSHHHGKKLSFTFSTSSSPFSSSSAFPSHSSSLHPGHTHHEDEKPRHHHSRGERSEEGTVVFGEPFSSSSHLASSSSSGAPHDLRKQLKFREKVLKITKEIIDEKYREKQLLLAYLKRLWYAKERVRKSLSTLLREYLKSLYQQYFEQIAETYALATYRRTPKLVKAYKKEVKKQAKFRSELQEKIFQSLQRHLDYGHRHAHYFIPTPSFFHDEEDDEEEGADEDNLFLHPYGHHYHSSSLPHHHAWKRQRHAKKQAVRKGMEVLERKLESTFHKKLHRHLRDIAKDQLRSIHEQQKHMRSLRDEMISQLSPSSFCETPQTSSSSPSTQKEGRKERETCRDDENAFTESLVRKIQNFHEQHPVDISRALASSRGSLLPSSLRSLGKEKKKTISG